jgi:hypothetical protein
MVREPDAMHMHEVQLGVYVIVHAELVEPQPILVARLEGDPSC